MTAESEHHCCCLGHNAFSLVGEISEVILGMNRTSDGMAD